MKKISLLCDQVRYSEFPELKFGVTEEQIAYYNIDQYLIEKELTNTHNIVNFQQKFFFFITKAATAYELNPETIILQEADTGQHLLICDLGLLFMMYTDPEFMFYTLDRMDEMLTNGIALSDAVILNLNSSRFPQSDKPES